jgi:3-methyladenine DNA glycosylase AlkD
MLSALTHDLRSRSDPEKAAFLPRFFKTGPGQYGEGDVFWGVTVPEIRMVVKTYPDLPLADVERLLKDPVHEMRLTGFLILVAQYEAAKKDPLLRQKIVDFYLAHARKANNWDLVDASAHKILGAHLQASGGTAMLDTLARSENLWEQRIAMVATLACIRAGDTAPCFRIAALLLRHPHDLMHKASGWMLREAGKKDPEGLRAFLEKHASTMPRTMLRYAIEKMDAEERQRYMRMKEQKK